MRYLIAVLAIIGIFTIDGCGKHNGPSIIERTSQDGSVSVEIDTKRTFPRDELPTGVDPGEVAAVITLGGLDADPGPSEPTPQEDAGIIATVKSKITPKAKAPKKQDNQLFVMKDGRVIAGKEAAGKIQEAEKVERSWIWLWWIIGILVALVAFAWSVGKLTKPIEIIRGFFKRG